MPITHSLTTKTRAFAFFDEGKPAEWVAATLSIGARTAYAWRKEWLASKAAPTPAAEPLEVANLKAQVTQLKAALSSTQRDAITETNIRSRIIGLRDSVAELVVPQWMIARKDGHSPHGVPTLVLSDLHWGEVVYPSQINGVNEFNLEIAHRRLKQCIESAVHLLEILDPTMDYPGIVLPLAGDMISGNLHDELSATNELNTMPTVIDLYGALVAAIETLSAIFPHVFVPCVTGNHGKDTKKIWAKDRHATSFDWLLYSFLAKHFENDPKVTFYVPDSLDAHYNIYGTRYKLTHGDRLGRGGDGIIGFLGPVTRGDHKNRSRDAQIGLSYDVMIHGHWHQYNHGSRVISNGTLKGMDEYAYTEGFGYEPPQQALFLTHPKRGITYRMPVYVDRPDAHTVEEWVTVKAVKRA